MNVNGTYRYTASFANVGQTSTVTQPLTSGLAGDPPSRGRITRVKITKTGGPGALATVIFREGGGGTIRLQFTDETLDADKQPLPVRYQVTNPTDLVVDGLSSDDATDSTSFDIEVDIERDD